MNKLSDEKRMMILSQLVEGCSIRSIERVTGVHRDTIVRLLVDAGETAKEVMDSQMMNLRCRFVQVDEIWSYVGKKQKQCTNEEKKAGEVGDQYVFVAIDSETKLIPAFMVGKRTGENAYTFMRELKMRISNVFQLSTDAFGPYFSCVDEVFHDRIHYGQIIKQYAEDGKGEKRYSPAQIINVEITPMIGNPRVDKISTSHIERQNLTMRMQMRRFTRLTNAFSKKVKNLECAVSLHFYHYNFMRLHQSLRITPAMEAKVTNRIWDWNDLLNFNSQSIAA